MKIATWNVNGIRARQAQFVEWVELHSPDIVCLQEIKAGPNQLPEALTLLPSYWHYWHGQGGYSGVSLHVRKESLPRPEFTHPPFDHETRIAEAVFPNFSVASVYVPNGGKDYAAKLSFLARLGEYSAGRQGGKPVVLCGDMNVTRGDKDVHTSQRNADAIGQRADERELFEGVIGHGLVDVARHISPEDDRTFTWWPYWRSARERNLGWRIDYILASEALAKTAQACQVWREFGSSDHAPLMAEFATSP